MNSHHEIDADPAVQKSGYEQVIDSGITVILRTDSALRR